MNIFAALFRRKTAASSSETTPAFGSYIKSEIKEAGRCESVAALGPFISHYSGYVREAAIARCVELARPGCLLAVAERLNDWVPQVRQMARAAVLTLLPFVPTAELLATLPLIAGLVRARRTDHTEWVATFEQALIGRVSTEELITGALAADIKVARACFAILKHRQLLDLPALSDLMLSSRTDIVVAVEAARLCADLPADSRREQYLAATKSHFGAVRTIALRGLLRDEGVSNRHELAVGTLFELQSSVRDVAITYLKAAGFDLRSYYREAIQNDALPVKLVQVGLMSLGSLGNKDDIALVKSFADSTHPQVRLAALGAWLKLGGHDKDTIAMAALMDDALGVRKYALRLVRRFGAYLPYRTVKKTLEERGDVRLLLRFSESQKWEWLDCIARLSLQAPPDSTLVPELRAALEKWLRQAARGYETATPEQTRFLSSDGTLSALEKLLPHQRSLMARLRLDLSA